MKSGLIFQPFGCVGIVSGDISFGTSTRRLAKNGDLEREGGEGSIGRSFLGVMDQVYVETQLLLLPHSQVGCKRVAELLSTQSSDSDRPSNHAFSTAVFAPVSLGQTRRR